MMRMRRFQSKDPPPALLDIYPAVGMEIPGISLPYHLVSAATGSRPHIQNITTMSSSSSTSSSNNSSGNNLTWIRNVLLSTSKLLSGFRMTGRNGLMSASASQQSLSGSSTKGYQQLSAEDEDNNNEDQQQCNRKKKKKDEDPSMTRTTSSRFGSIDEDDMSSSSDSDEDEDERLERLTCWVCERAFSSTKILDRHKIRERHFGCGTCDQVFQTQMALERHQEEEDHWSDDDEDEDYDEEEDTDDGESEDGGTSSDPESGCEDSQLDTEDEMELQGISSSRSVPSFDSHGQLKKKERAFLL